MAKKGFVQKLISIELGELRRNMLRKGAKSHGFTIGIRRTKEEAATKPSWTRIKGKFYPSFRRSVDECTPSSSVNHSHQPPNTVVTDSAMSVSTFRSLNAEDAWEKQRLQRELDEKTKVSQTKQSECF
jgi:hypothetical protein